MRERNSWINKLWNVKKMVVTVIEISQFCFSAVTYSLNQPYSCITLARHHTAVGGGRVAAAAAHPIRLDHNSDTFADGLSLDDSETRSWPVSPTDRRLAQCPPSARLRCTCWRHTAPPTAPSAARCTPFGTSPVSASYLQVAAIMISYAHNDDLSIHLLKQKEPKAAYIEFVYIQSKVYFYRKKSHSIWHVDTTTNQKVLYEKNMTINKSRIKMSHKHREAGKIS